MLIEKQIPATFFVSGRWAVKHEGALRQLLEVPFFEIGTHGHVHAHLPGLDEAAQRREIEQAVILMRERFGRPTTLFRPPYGEYDERTLHVADVLGLRLVLWSVVSGDPDPRLSREAIASVVTERAAPGAIVIFHANGKGRHTKDVIDQWSQGGMQQHGLRPVTVSELLTACGDSRSAH
jgi:peptidoglycan/xylan/chitin deacetylase (PgdA/CDA1 family)